MKRILFLALALTLIFSSPAWAASTYYKPTAGSELPTTCTNGQMVTYNTTTGLWDTCADATGSGDITDVWACTGANCNALTAASGDTLDASLANSTIPDKQGTTAELPGTCTEGMTYWSSNGDAHYTCTAENTWRLDYNQSLAAAGNPSFNTINVVGTNSLNLGTASTNTGQVVFKNSTNANTFTVQPGATGASISWTLPTAAPGGANYLLNTDADGTMGYTDPAAFVPLTLFDANTILAANSDNTPAAVTIAEDRLVGRATGGNIAALTLGTGLSIAGGALTIGTLNQNTTGTAATLSDGDKGEISVSSGSLSIDANVVTAAKLAAALIFAEGDLIDLSGITMSGTNDEGLTLPFWADVTPTSGATKRFFTWDEAGGVMKVYTAGGWVTVNPSAGAPTDVAYIVTGSLSGSLSAERLLTEGTGIDFTDAGANGNFTIAVDSTEIGTTTWGSGSAITWTFNASGGADTTIAFGDGTVTVVGAVTATSFSGALTGNVTGTVSGNAGTATALAANPTDCSANQFANAIAASGNLTCAQPTPADLALGTLAVAMTVGTGGSVAPSGTGTITATNIVAGTGTASISGPTTARVITIDDAAQELAARNRANTFTENNTFGNADTDTFTIRSLIVGGNSRAVWIAGSAPTPTYATGTNELYVAGDIETAGTVYAAAFNTGTGTEGERRISLTSNTAFNCASYPDSIYFQGDALMFCNSTAAKTPARLEDTQSFTGLKTFEAGIYVGDSDTAAIFKLSDGSAHYWVLASPSIAADMTLTLPTTAGVTGQYLKTTTAGNTATLSWDTPTASADTTGGTGGVQFNAGGVLTSDAGFVFTTATDKLTLGTSGGATTGTLDLYYTGTAFAATITPNASMGSGVTITLPAVSGTLISAAGSNTWLAAQTINYANSNTDNDFLTLGGAAITLNADDVYRGIVFTPGTVTASSTGNTITGVALGNLGTHTNSTGYGLSVGTGYDFGIYNQSITYLGDGTNGVTVSATGAMSFAGTATFSAGSATTSIPMVVGTGTASGVTAAGQMYFESDTEILTIGDGATSISLHFTPNTVITFPSATSTLQTTTGTPAGFVIASQATGDLLYASSGSAWARLPAGATTEILVGGGAAVPVWTTATGTGAPARAGSPTFTTKITTPLIDLGTGISVTGGAGVITFTDLAGTSEVLSLDLRTANTAKLTTTSAVDTLDIGALNLATTGTIQGGIVISSDADGMDAAAMTAAGMYGTMFIATGAGTWILPRAVLGQSVCLMDSGTAHDLILDVTAGSTIRLKGTEQADGIGITNAAGSTTGDFVCVIAVATDKWSTAGIGGAWLSQ